MPEHGTALRSLDLSDIVAALDEMRTHDIRLFANLTPAELQTRLALTPPTHPVVSIELRDERSIEQCIEAAVVQIGRAVARLWPFVWGGEDFSELRDDALSRAYLPIRFVALAARLPELRPAVAGDIAIRLMQGRPLRLPNAPMAVAWEQLTLAFAPDGLTVAVWLPNDGVASVRIRAVEWLAHHANVRIAVLTDGEADAYERIAYGARHVALAVRDEAGETVPDVSTPIDAPLVLALPPAPEGRPHPMSPIEQKLYRLIQRDDELRPLFVFNKTVHLPLLAARIDLVWLDGRVAVEIDGAEHRAAAKFRADRHRDYELTCAGYRVLRMTNEDVETDAALAIEKIRTVARLARMEAR